MADKLVYAVTDTTVHVKQGQQNSDFGNFEIVEGYNLAAGETIALSKLASYQQEAFEAGDVASVEVVSQAEADKRAKKDAEVAEAVAKASGGQTLQANFALGDDGSYSDHLVSDVDRVANHAARAEAEAGDGSGPDEKVTVAGAEEASSPANAGVETDADASKVQGSGGADAAKKSK